jgi:hypothetical protein
MEIFAWLNRAGPRNASKRWLRTGAAVAPGSRYCDAHLKLALSPKGYEAHAARRQEMERFRNSAAKSGAGHGSGMKTHAHT